MTEREVSLSPAKWTASIIAFVALTGIAILLDIPFLRQISGFLFLTFIPGFLILSILKLNKPGLADKIVLSLGLSVAFSMFFGLLLNSALLALGYIRPLSTIPILILFSTATIVLSIVAYIRNKGIVLSLPNLKLTTMEKALFIVPSFFPLLTIVGTRLMNMSDNNVLLMLLLLLIPACVILVSFCRDKISQGLYPGFIYFISISLVLMLALRLNHVLGADAHDFYYLFQRTLQEGHWGLYNMYLQDANLSISLLPTMYQSLMNLNGEYLFKILYPLLFSSSPLVVYIICRKYIGSGDAFLASFLFMAQVTFLWTTGVSTNNMAVLFFALTIMVLFHQDIGEFAKRLLFIIFAAVSITSHYATAYIFFFLLFFTWLGMQIIPGILHSQRKAAAPPENTMAAGTLSNPLSGEVTPNSDADTSQSAALVLAQFRLTRGVTTTIVLLFFIMLFFWYSQITGVPFSVGVGFIGKTFLNLNQWFLIEAKGTTVTAALGENIATIPQQIRLVVSWFTVALVAIGVLSAVVSYKRMVSVPQSDQIKPDFLGSKFEMEYFLLALAGSALLGISVALPLISVFYSMERIFFQMLPVLSPFFVIGGIMAAKWLRARPHWIILPVLILFFMSTTGTTYQLAGHRESMMLNSEGSDVRAWVYDQESSAAKWITQYGKREGFTYAGPLLGTRVFESQGLVHPDKVRNLIYEYQQGREINGYIYLRKVDLTVQNLVVEYPDIFASKNKIYSAGISEVYR